MSLKVVKPIEVTDAVLTESNVPEPDTARGEVEYDPNKTEGITFSNVTWNITDFARDGGTIYALDEFPFSPSGTSLVRTYDINGNETAAAFYTQNDAKCIDVYLGSIYVGDSNGFVNKYSPSGILLETFDLTASVSRVDAICGSYGPFYILDQTTGKVFEFGTLNDLTPFEVRDFGTVGSFIFGFTHRNGIIYYTNQNNGKIESMSAGTGDARSSFALTNERDGVYYFGGLLFLADGSLLSLNTTGNKSFKYVNGILKQPYNPGDQVVILSNHTKYQCLVATSQSPLDGATEDAAATWIKVGPTNKWAMFVDTINSASVITKDSVARRRNFVLKPQQKFTSCAIFGCYGLKQVFFQVFTSSDVLRHSIKVDMIDYDAAIEWGLDDASPAFIDSAFIDGLNYSDGDYFQLIIDAEIGFEGGVKLFAFGIDRFIGESVNESMRKNYIDLSNYDNDQFGNTRITKRPVVALNTYSALVENARIDVVDRFLNSLAGEFNLWIADIGNGQKMLTYGAYERAPTEINHNSYRVYTATIRSAI